jgi:serine/threonine-protein kinase HipA
LTSRTLDVVCFGEHAGTLTDEPAGMTFAYGRSWLEADRPPLSQSLPLSGEFGTVDVVAFFGGLLPEGTPRQILARQLGVSAANDFGLLEALGGDTAGAVSLLAPGSAIPSTTGDDVEWLDEGELSELIAEIPSRPMHADSDGEWRLSLAGAQDKLPVIVGADGRVGLTRGRTPSTHILKTPIAGLHNTVANEAYCLELGRRLGIDTAAAVPRRAGDRECLLVARYDRRATPAGVERLHQEDFCQALGVPSARKYQAEGGPGFADCFGLIRTSVPVPARESPRLLDYLGLSFLVGNHDAHGKNFSLLYNAESHHAALAPAYDILSTVAYRDFKPMSRKMAMHIGGEYRPDWVRARHLDRLLTDAKLGPAASRRRLRALALDAPAHAADVRKELVDGNWDRNILEAIEAVVAERSRMLAAIASPRAGSSR